MNGSRTALAFDTPKAISLEAKEMVHAVSRAIDPLFDRDLMTEAVVVQDLLVASRCCAGRLATLLPDLSGGRTDAYQRTSAAVRRGRVR